MSEGDSPKPESDSKTETPRRPNALLRALSLTGRGARVLGRGAYRAFDWLLPGRRVAGLAVTGLIVAALLFPMRARDHIMDIWRAINPPPPSGLIVVDSPQIFTRERLVNDRFTEERWLAAQLDRTDTLLEDGRFARPYIWAQEAISRSMGGAPAAPDGSMASNPDADLPAPIWEYEDAMAYRNRIRYAKIATQLDDAHDIDSNTLYRMNFSISVLPDRNEEAIAVVKIAIKESDLAGELEHYYTQLLSEYVDILQQTVNNVYDDRLSTVEQGQGFAPSEALEVDHFLRHEVEKLVPRLAEPPLRANTAFARRKQAEAFINQTLGRLIEARLNFDRQQNGRAARSLVGSFGDALSEQEQRQLTGNYLGLCQGGRVSVSMTEVVPQWLRKRLFDSNSATAHTHFRCSTLPRNWPLQARFQIVTGLRAIAAQLYGLKDYALPMDHRGRFEKNSPLSIPDDLFGNPCGAGNGAQGISEADILDALAYVLYGSAGAKPAAPSPGATPGSGPETRPGPPRFEHACAAFRSAVRAARRDLVGGLGPAALPPLRIGIAEYVRRTMELLRSKRLSRTLSYYFDFDLASCAPTHCSIKVTDRYSSRGREARDTAMARARIHAFYENLNCGARAQTYALTPKKDANYLGLQQFSQATISMLADSGSPGAVQASEEKSRKGQIQQPSIIGLGDWGRLDRRDDAMRHCLQSIADAEAGLFATSRNFFAFFQQQSPVKGSKRSFLRSLRRQSDVATHFGWMILPRANMADEIGNDAQVDDSVLVSALVSLPSWWGRAQIEVETCWMERNEVSDMLQVEDLCSSTDEEGQSIGISKQDHIMHVKLPGTAEEVLSRMAFFPLKTPYLTEGRGQANVVEVGRPGHVTLVGSRLWKNPRVRMGHQWADSVEVLPDMRGLIARFACIEPEPGLAAIEVGNGSGNRLRSAGNRPVRIWTSEGTTSTVSVIVRPFNSRHKNVALDPPCWVEDKQAG